MRTRFIFLTKDEINELHKGKPIEIKRDDEVIVIDIGEREWSKEEIEAYSVNQKNDE